MEKLIIWVEIPTENFDRAVDFYSAILDLDLEKLDFGSEKMACFPTGEGAIVSAPGFKPGKDGVLVSLNTGDQLDAVIDRVKNAGGTIVQPKTKIEAENRGFFAIFTDSEGNKVGLYGNK